MREYSSSSCRTEIRATTLTSLMTFTGCLRYNVLIVGSNPFGAESELALDDLSLSPQCFGLAVGDKERGSWRYNMTDAEFCEYFGRADCSKTNNFGNFES